MSDELMRKRLEYGDKMYRATLPVRWAQEREPSRIPGLGRLLPAEPCAPYIHFDEWVVCRVTPKGYWIVQGPELRPRWVTEKTRFASPTKEEAIERLRRRTESYVRHSQRRLIEAKIRLKALNEGTAEPLPHLSVYTPKR